MTPEEAGQRLSAAVHDACSLAARSVSPDPAVREAALAEATARRAALEQAPSYGERLARALRDAAARIA